LSQDQEDSEKTDVLFKIEPIEEMKLPPMALHAGASEQELLETAFTIIPVAGMPAFAIFLGAWKQARQAK